MNLQVMSFLGTIFTVFIILDIIMLVSLLKPGDERNQIIVWKASTFTLFATMGEKAVQIAISFITAQSITSNHFVQLEVTALIYFFALMFYKKRHSG